MSKAPKSRQATTKGGTGKPAGQMNWLLIAVWAVACIFLYKSCGQTPPAEKSVPPAQIFTQLVDENHKLQEASAAQTYSKYTSALQDEISQQKELVKNGKAQESSVTALEDSLEGKKIHAAILVADAQLRGGRATHQYNKYFNAYNTLQPFFLKDQTNPAWTQAEYSTENRKGEVKSWTGIGLYNQVVSELKVESRHDLVYGLIPGWQATDFFVKITGRIPGFSYWFAALLLAVVVRALVWPLTQKQIRFGRQMQQLMPRIKEIKAKNPKDMATTQSETMALYKEYGLNPAAGCLPALIQAPFFFVIYDCMLRYRFEFQNGTFLWLNPHFATLTHGWTAPNLGQQDNILIILYAITMLSSQWLMPVSDPTQWKQQRIMGAVISIIFPAMMFFDFYQLPSAFVLYWTFLNIIATAQALIAYSKPVAPLEKKVLATGGVMPGHKAGLWERIQGEMERKYSESKGIAPKAESTPSKEVSFWDRIQDDAKKAMQEKAANSANPNGNDSQNGANGSQNGKNSGSKSKPKRRT